MSDFKKKKKGTKPTKEEAEFAMEMINLLQKKGDEESEKKRQEEESLREQQMTQEIEMERVRVAQEKVKRKLKENLKKKKEEKKKNTVKNFLESAVTRNSKIKWKSVKNGNVLQGYVDDKIIFEIKRGFTLFSLYVKDEKTIEKYKLKTHYLGCSVNIHKLKFKSDKLI